MAEKWTIYGAKVLDGKIAYAAGRTFDTKRQAVVAMNTARKPKTAILRVGRTYTFALPE